MIRGSGKGLCAVADSVVWLLAVIVVLAVAVAILAVVTWRARGTATLARLDEWQRRNDEEGRELLKLLGMPLRS